MIAMRRPAPSTSFKERINVDQVVHILIIAVAFALAYLSIRATATWLIRELSATPTPSGYGDYNASSDAASGGSYTYYSAEQSTASKWWMFAFMTTLLLWVMALPLYLISETIGWIRKTTPPFKRTIDHFGGTMGFVTLVVFAIFIVVDTMTHQTVYIH